MTFVGEANLRVHIAALRKTWSSPRDPSLVPRTLQYDQEVTARITLQRVPISRPPSA